MLLKASKHKAAVWAGLLAGTGLLASGAEVRSQSWGPDYGAPPKGSQWVKLCDGTSVGRTPACRLLHERVDSRAGSNVIKVELRDVIGTASEKTLIVSLKPDFKAADGIQIVLYSAEQWADFKKKTAIAPAELKKLRITPMACSAVECVAKSKIGGRVWEQWPTFAGFVVYALDASGKPMGFPVPLEGFAATAAGGAVDPRVYARARERLLQRGDTARNRVPPGAEGTRPPGPAPASPPVVPKLRPKGGVEA